LLKNEIDIVRPFEESKYYHDTNNVSNETAIKAQRHFPFQAPRQEEQRYSHTPLGETQRPLYPVRDPFRYGNGMQQFNNFRNYKSDNRDQNFLSKPHCGFFFSSPEHQNVGMMVFPDSHDSPTRSPVVHKRAKSNPWEEKGGQSIWQQHQHVHAPKQYAQSYNPHFVRGDETTPIYAQQMSSLGYPIRGNYY